MLGTLGLSLIRHWYVDGQANKTRVAELRDLLGRLDQEPYAMALNPVSRDLDTGYAEWAETYDGPNPMVAAEEAVVHAILDRHAGPGVRALDAGCGTGRHAAFLAEQGCRVTGTDRSGAMLERARGKVPGAEFHLADLRELPFRDRTFDLAVVSLALSHLADPTDALVELCRVLRSGGTLVISDPHPSSLALGGQAFYGGPRDGVQLRWVRNHHHPASTWLRGFRTAGLEVVDCAEPPYSEAEAALHPASAEYPEATRTAMVGFPFLWVWTLRRP